MKEIPIFACFLIIGTINCIIIAVYFQNNDFDGDSRFLGQRNTTQNHNKFLADTDSLIEDALKKNNSTQELNFLLFGDYGFLNNENEPLPNTKELADFVFNRAKSAPIPYNFIISLGDMLYKAGIKSKNDPRPDILFDEVFKIHQLGLNWYAVLGNHDYMGDIPATLELEKKYYPFWQQSELYYYKVLPIGTSQYKAGFVFLDSSQLACLTKESSECMKPTHKNVNFDKLQDQIVWLEDVLAMMIKDEEIAWRIIVIHSGIFSAGVLHDNKDIKEAILPLLVKYKVDLILSGHDHSVQYLRMELNQSHAEILSDDSLGISDNKKNEISNSQKILDVETNDQNIKCWKELNKNECFVREFFEEELQHCENIKKQDENGLSDFLDYGVMKQLLGFKDIQYVRESRSSQYEHLHQFIIGNGSSMKHRICPLRQQKSEGKLKYGNTALGIGDVKIREDSIEIKLVSTQDEILYQVIISR